ncbi:phycobilin lyase, CpcU subunit [Xenococcus sp. PCC 7305]|uniref:phycobiliprotein lyase n=1 Tax=Xenococcus sp. PCC 7305 TaxID=102125 RepID=UPI0002ABF925|nr:phycobiliprotein lyase [Xenococcus sp. PCC 7305]ELS03484.1 phycobilin lyase, CpcU subunit [Xenococcus sp. PCC 7305]
MDIKEFIDLCAGNWFSQRTDYQVETEKTESNKADLSITLIATNDAKVSQLCLQNRIDSQLSLGGLQHSWASSGDWGKPKQQGSSMVVIIPDPENPQTGKIISNAANQNLLGTYVFGNDSALTLIFETKDKSIEERIWFASDNLRLRTAITKNEDGTMSTLFYSEIRKAPPKKEEATN